jgi:hypothetical protein
MILAVTDPEDVHAPPVLEAVRRLGWRCQLLDLARLPREVQLSFSAGRPANATRFAAADGSGFDAAEVAAVWWRRPRPYVPDPALAPAVATWASIQVHAALSGVWGALHAGWVNDPWLDERAGHKPAQLAAAEAAGLLVPPTLVSCAPDEARAFLAELGERPVVQKPLRPTEASWRPTRLVTAEDRGRLDDLRYAPAILQAYVPGVDVRVTIAGGRLFATEIDVRHTSSPHDFRPAFREAAVAPCLLPADVERGLWALLEALGLRYGAVDLRRDDDGRHFFLEINPAGQWLFLEERTGQPITRAVAEALVEAALAARASSPTGRPRRAAGARSRR